MKNIHVFSGGGVRGIGSLKLVEHLAVAPDFVAGTSTGAIIAAAKAIGYSYQEILQLYLDNIKIIFQEQHFDFDGMTKPKYFASNLRKVMQNIFENRTNKDCKLDLMINACNYTLKQPKYWKSWDSETWLLSDAVTASCSAPTYFKPHKIDFYQFIDGGIESNNIGDSALIEAIGRYGEELAITIVGTGEYNKFDEIKTGSTLEWLKEGRLIDIMLDMNLKSSIYKLKEHINERGNIDLFQYLNWSMSENIKLDDLTKIDYLLNVSK